MERLPRIVAADYLGGHRLRLTFTDGLVRELDFAETLDGGILVPLRDEDFFAQVSVDSEAGTIAWPNGVDFDPDVLHGDFEPVSGRPPRLIREYRLRETG